MTISVDSTPQLNLQILQQGGEAAITEISTKLCSNIADPAAARSQAQKILETLQASGMLTLSPPETEGTRSPDLNTLTGSLGPASENIACDMQMVMGLFLKMAQSIRQSSRDERQAELTQQADALGAAAQEIRAAAQQRFVGALVQGSIQIAGGALSIGAGLGSLNSIRTSKTAATEAGNSAYNQASNKVINKGGTAGEAIDAGEAAFQSQYGATFQNSMKAADTFAQTAQGASQALQGAGAMANAAFEREAADHDANKAGYDKEATLHQAAHDSANDMMQQMQDVIRDIRDKISAMEQSNIETTRGIARNI